MSTDDVDIEQFIQEVKIRPVVWDVSHMDYKDRMKKQYAWENICEAVIENFSQKTLQEKYIIIKRLALKWKNLKDNYARSLRKRKSGKSGRRQYIYAKHLSFVLSSIGSTPTQSTQEKSDNIDSPHSQSQQEEDEDGFFSESATFPEVIFDSGLRNASPSTSRLSEPSTPRVSESSKWQSKFETALLNFINSPTVVDPPDEDKSFFDSLIPTIKSFNQDQKLDFRSGVLEVVKRVKRQNQTHIPSMAFSSQSQQINFVPPQNNLHAPSLIQCTAAGSSSSSMAASSLPSSTTSATSHIPIGLYHTKEPFPQPPTDSDKFFVNA